MVYRGGNVMVSLSPDEVGKTQSVEASQCEKCGRASVDLEIDHVVPLCMGGSNSPINLQCLCKACHKLKSDEESKKRE